MHGHQRIGLAVSSVSYVLNWYTLCDQHWAYDVSSLTSFGLWAFTGTGVTIKLVDAGAENLGYDVVTPSLRPSSFGAFCSIPPIHDHDPWCGAATDSARAFHIMGFLAATASYVISTHVVFERSFPSWDGGGTKASLPWATFLSFWHGVCSMAVLVSWGLAQDAMNDACIADNLTTKRPCISASYTFYVLIANTLTPFFLWWWWKHTHHWLEAKHSGALMDGFLLAAKTDDIDEILGQVAAKADINGLGSDGRNALHWACALNRTTVLHILVKKGANISQKDKDGWTPLHWASRMGNPDVVRLLVKHGADVNAKDTWGTTPLMLTVLGKSKTAAMCLLELGANINARNVFGQTALMLCVEEDAEMHAFVVMLLNAGASLTLRDVRPRLHRAVTVQCHHIQHILLVSSKGCLCCITLRARDSKTSCMSLLSVVCRTSLSK
ncbi:hypothetical protein, variant 1 [Aphanomyces invadans]|uniref:Uncharacterized protein n=1 Tax=Aphanomyces invadans TaxID=157072 RepID=A0A024U7L9_9STRA|nr:hypothetical protein, variant 1 [Aphanomyces invadans]ETW01608.1 hypothetical protein, variant 1 [Aphanomyces invadans]|eukprot:XP_008869456.1 hypothetical protein, variant 1 [Aphanomyces invadans]